MTFTSLLLEIELALCEHPIEAMHKITVLHSAHLISVNSTLKREVLSPVLRSLMRILCEFTRATLTGGPKWLKKAVAYDRRQQAFPVPLDES